ncbi:MAG: ribosome biogenesis GTP-binding protein YihA/YsxC [Candidatus Hydrogenedentes bacterium]|nr:ribosome biogenesis GTP-binding protein YihA/YsxC [Candidatus Hydrogenedentota bacterium]
MRIKSADFLKSAILPDQFPRDGRPEIAFAGRSNAGKSTLLNVLLNKKNLAKTSKRPGKTQMINFFDVNGSVYFVDLPGYGFAKVSKALREEWGRAITDYLATRNTLRIVAHLIDVRHKPSHNDHELLDLLEEAKVPTVLVATKVDKVGAAERMRYLEAMAEELGIDEVDSIIPFSAVSKEGLRELWNTIDACITRK